MKNSEVLSAKQSWNPKIKIIAIVIVLVSFFGFLDAGYLTVKHYTNTPINCSIFDGCDEVAFSSYAKVFNIPVALIGVLFYLMIFSAGILYITSQKRRIIDLIFILGTLAFSASIYFVYLQLFVIKAICFYCVLSAVSSTALFFLSLYLKLRTRNEV